MRRNMKDLKYIIGCGLILCGFIGIIICAILACVFAWQNPDMTEIRRFLEYPWPTVWCIADFVGMQIGLQLIKKE
jgi:hypothetical protein